MKRPLTRNGFTLIELLIVMILIAILSAMLVGAYKGVRARFLRASCANNMRLIVRALQLYVEDFETSPAPYADAKQLYGMLYYPQTGGRMGGITTMSVYVCPATRHIPPYPTGNYRDEITCTARNTDDDWGNPNYEGSSIDYWVVKRKNPANNLWTDYIPPDFTNIPQQNVVLWEVSRNDNWHHEGGKNLGYWNGSVRFFSSTEPDDYPRNLDENGIYETDDGAEIPTVDNRDRHVFPWFP